MATQWRTGFGRRGEVFDVIWLGLDYAAVRAGLDAIGTEVTAQLWKSLQVIEVQARELLNGARAG